MAPGILPMLVSGVYAVSCTHTHTHTHFILLKFSVVSSCSYGMSKVGSLTVTRCSVVM